MTAGLPASARIDRRLEQVRDLAGRIGSNLVALDRDPVRQVLDGSTLSGATEAAWHQAAERLAQLFQGHAAIGAVIDEATRLRSARRRPTPADLERLEALLFGPSVSVTWAPPPPATVPEALATAPPAPPLETLDEAVSSLSSTYAALATTLAKAAAVWDAVVPRLVDLRHDLDRGVDRAVSAGGRVPNAAKSLGSQLDASLAVAISDPLSVEPGALDALSAAVQQLLAGLEGAAEAQREVGAHLAELSSSLAEVDAVLATAAESYDEARRKLSGWGDPDARGLDRARKEAAALRAALEELPTAADPVGRVDAMRRRASVLKADAAQLAAGAAEGLDRRAELRGRLDAYRMRAVAAGRGEDAALEQVYTAAQALLWSAPCDLDQAAAAVSRYQDAVRGRAPTEGRPG